MAEQLGVLRACRRETGVTFQLHGWARMKQGLVLRRLAEECLGDGVAVLHVDLRHCTYMDSTFVGTLLFLKRAVHALERGEFSILSPSAECRELLCNMRLDGIFPTATAEELVGVAWTELACELVESGVLKITVADAHQELASQSGAAGQAFQGVARFLNEEAAPASSSK